MSKFALMDQVEELNARIETLEAALRRAYDFLQDKAFTPVALTHECTDVVGLINAALDKNMNK